MNPPGSHVSRLEALEREVSDLRAQLARIVGRDAVSAPVQQTWLAQTYESSPGNWPTPPANVFDIRFLRPTVDVWSPGNRTVTLTPRSASQQAVAATFDNRYLLPNVEIEVIRIAGRWFVVGTQGLHYHGRLLGSLAKGSSATMEILRYNGSKEIRTGYEITVYDRYFNTGDSRPAKTKVEVRMEYPGRYDVVNAYCEADSNADSDYDP